VKLRWSTARPKSASRPLPSGGTLPIVTASASKSRPPAADEVAAADAVAAVRSDDLGIRVNWDHADTGAEQKMHDFWLVGNGVREALEITTLMEQDAMTDLKHWQKVGPGHDIIIPGLAQAWTIMIDPQFNAKALTNRLAEWLQALERTICGWSPNRTEQSLRTRRRVSWTMTSSRPGRSSTSRRG
jgi:hypothetical protein